MSATVIKKGQRELLDLGTKRFYKYNSPTKRFEVKKTVLNGRSPEDISKAYVETDCPFAIFILKGTGRITVDGHPIELEPEDVVYVLENTKWFIEGDLEYVVFNAPAWYPEQMKEIEL